MPNISRSKVNQTMKLGHLIKYNKRKFFLQKSCWKWGSETSPRPLFTFGKTLIWGKTKWSPAYFQYVSIALNLAYNKNKLYKTSDYWSRDTFSFKFSEKGLWIVSPSHFVHDFSRKIFLVLQFINWPNFTVCLPLLLEILGIMCITIAC